MRPVRLVMILGVLVTVLFSVATLSGQSNPVSAAQATGAATVAPTTAGGGAVTATLTTGGGATAAATTAATSSTTTGGGATAVPPTATLTLTATRQPAGRPTAGPRPVVFGPCPNPHAAAPAPTATLARTPTAVAAIDMGTGVTVVTDTRSALVAQGGQFEIVTQVLDLQPGAATPPHVHTGSATVVVIDGEVTNCTATTQQVYRAGESFTERPNLVGQVVNTGSAVARIAMIMLAPRNLPPMVVVPVITATPGTR